jgi:hypothetical protein
MRDIIEVEKTEMPYDFNIVLGSEEFNLEFKYNEAVDLFTCTLSKNDEVLVYDEPLIYGSKLFQDVYNAAKFPCLDIVPLDESGKENTVTYDNLGVTVFLTIDDEVE